MKRFAQDAMLTRSIFTLLLCGALSSRAIAQITFRVVPLGILGGIDESNLSSYALAVAGTDDYICLDAGTLHAGIQKAIKGGVWKGESTTFLKDHVKGYLISHPHLDHLSGMIINSPDDSPKFIYATEPCIDVMKEKYFSWKGWANFTNEGEPPSLNKYTFVHLVPGTEFQIKNTPLSVSAFALSHGNPYESTAFLINYNGTFLLYLGDTGSDEIEKSDKLHLLWKSIAGLIKAHSLKSIFIEVSYSNEQPLNLLFGHLTPQLFIHEMDALAKLCGSNDLQKISIVITHMKPSGNREENIRKQLTKLNAMGLKLVFPKQGELMEF